MSNDLPIDDQVVDQDENKKEEITQLSPEGLPVEIGSIEKEDLFEDLEREVTPEVPKPAAKKEVSSSQESEQIVQEEDTSKPPENVVDKRTPNDQTTEINDARQSLTREADDKEEDFIDHVEEVHTIA